MPSKMEWPRLLSHDRSYYTMAGTPFHGRDPKHPTTHQEDAERIIYSSAFRRLQGKTQVYPFSVLDYTRTRLTHTNEVAYVGRVLASTAGNRIAASRKADIKEIESALGSPFSQVLADVTYAACLAHDVGNPPFGHVGEDAIKTWFAKQFGAYDINKKFTEMLDLVGDAPTKEVIRKTQDLVNRKQQNYQIRNLERLADQEKNDFLHLEGNAQGFRTLTRLTGWRQKGGLQLTHATLGAFSKYPHSSLSPRSTKKRRKKIWLHR